MLGSQRPTTYFSLCPCLHPPQDPDPRRRPAAPTRDVPAAAQAPNPVSAPHPPPPAASPHAHGAPGLQRSLLVREGSWCDVCPATMSSQGPPGLSCLTGLLPWPTSRRPLTLVSPGNCLITTSRSCPACTGARSWRRCEWGRGWGGSEQIPDSLPGGLWTFPVVGAGAGAGPRPGQQLTGQEPVPRESAGGSLRVESNRAVRGQTTSAWGARPRRGLPSEHTVTSPSHTCTLACACHPCNARAHTVGARILT